MTIGQDFRSALRQIRRQPRLSAAIVMMLALAMSTSTAVFSYVNALLLRPAPWKDPERLVEIHSIRGGQVGKLSMLEIEDLRREIPTIEAMAAHSGSYGGYNFGGEGTPEEWRAVLTTGNLFDVLGVPLIEGGRWPETADRGRDFRVVLSYPTWKRAFGGLPVVGKKIALDHAPGYEIHGVLPEGFDFPSGVEVYRSIGGFTNYEGRTRRNVVGIARIKPGTSLEELRARLATFATRQAELYPETNAGMGIGAVSLLEQQRGPARPYLLVLVGAVVCVLLIAAFNVANLLLARALERGRELGVRTALGASRGELVRQLSVEALVLALVSCVLGIALGIVWMEFLRVVVVADLPAWMKVEIDATVLALSVAVVFATAFLSALPPAFQATRAALSSSLKEVARGGSSGRGAAQVRDALVVAQVSFAFVLLSGAGLLVRGFSDLLSTERGFSSERLATFRVALGWKRYGADQTVQYYERALEELRRVPGVEAVGFINNPPLARQSVDVPVEIQAEHQTLAEARQNPYVVYQQASESYFAVVGVPLVSGRLFTEFDRKDTEPVAIVSKRLAEHLWPGQDPLGKRLRHDPTRSEPPPLRTVVGVTGDVTHHSLGGEKSHDVYVPFRQSPAANQYLIARTRLSPAQFRASAERALWSIDPEQSLFDFKTYDERIMAGVWALRLAERLLLLFGVVAFILAAAGVAAALAHAARQRIREIGIRLVMGATPESARDLVLYRGVRLGAIGLAIGGVGAALFGLALSSAFPAIPRVDPMTFAGALALFGVTVLLAGLRPARDAARTDPVILLRDE